MIRDPIVDEVRQARRLTEEACGHDWARLIEHYRRVETAAGRLIQHEPRQPQELAAKDNPPRV